MVDTHPLRIDAARPRDLSPEHRARWAAVIEAFQEPFSAVSVIWLAELLERLDGGAPCSFEGRASIGDMGAEESALRLSTGRLGLVREVDEHYDSWELKVVGSSRQEAWGFPPGQRFDWHGLALSGSTWVTLERVDRALKEDLVALARSLFEEVEVQWGGDPAPLPPVPPEQLAARLLVREPLDQGVALIRVSYEDGIAYGEWMEAVFRSREDAEQYCRLMRVPLGGGGGGRSWMAYELRPIHGGKPESMVE
jgi:hypothetical protein